MKRLWIIFLCFVLLLIVLWIVWEFQHYDNKKESAEVEILIPRDLIELDSIEPPYYYQIDSITGDSIKIELRVCGRYYEMMRNNSKR